MSNPDCIVIDPYENCTAPQIFKKLCTPLVFRTLISCLASVNCLGCILIFTSELQSGVFPKNHTLVMLAIIYTSDRNLQIFAARYSTIVYSGKGNQIYTILIHLKWGEKYSLIKVVNQSPDS